MGTCTSAGISLCCGYQQHYWVFQPCSATALPSLEAWHHNFALVKILAEAVFPEQEIRYIQATIKQTAAYRKPKYELPEFLQEKPHTIQSICLMNIERAKAIPKSHVTQEESVGVYSLASSSSISEQSWTVNIPAGLCTCPSFLSAHIPCKHMFAIFHHYP